MFQSESAKFPYTTIIIPAYNEESRIRGVLDEITAFVSGNSLNWRVIVSIDGTDGTEDLVKEYSKTHSYVGIMKGEERSGKGYAVKRVIERVESDYTLIMDADGAVKLNDIVSNFNQLDNYDVITFDRYSNHGNTIPFLRRIPSRGFNLLLRAILKIDVRDTQCGYKVIKTSLAKEALKRTTVTNTFFDVSLIYYLKKIGARIKEVSIRYEHTEGSKFNILQEIVGQGISLAAFMVRHSKFYKYLPDWLKDLYARKFRWI